MHAHRAPSSTHRHGAALVVALGLLSLILLLVTTFVLTLRSERLTARNAREKTSSREYASIASFFGGNYYLPIPENSQPKDPTYFIPRVDFLDQVRFATETPEFPSEDEDDVDEVLRKVYPNDSLQTFEPTYLDGIVGLHGTEIGGQEAVFFGSDEATRFATLPGTVTNFLPHLYTHILETNALPLRWQYIHCANVEPGAEEGDDVRLAIRTTFLLADLSGQANIHTLSTNQWRMLGIPDPESLTSSLTNLPPFIHRPDLQSFLETKLPSVSLSEEDLDALGVYTLDPDPNQIPYRAAIGSPDLRVLNKFDLASITNSAEGCDLLFETLSESDDPRLRWQEASDRSEDVRDWLTSLSNVLFRIGPRAYSKSTSSNELARAIFWNLLNDLDGDRYPQTDTDTPWLNSYGIEALPLLSELCVTNTTAFDTSLPDTPDFGFLDDCPACQALKTSLSDSVRAERTYQAAAEIWYPFVSTNDLPDKVWLALHLYKSSYTNDISSVVDRLQDSLDTVTEIVEAHWGTNVVRTTYRHSRDVSLIVPPTQRQSLEFGAYGAPSEESNFFLATGLAIGPPPASLEDQLLQGTSTISNDVTISILTNALDTLSILATTQSTHPPLHLYDTLLTGPMGSLLKGEALLLYSSTSNLVVDPSTPIDPDDPPPEPVYEEIFTTSFLFTPDDQDALKEALYALTHPVETDESDEPDELGEPGEPDDTLPPTAPDGEPEPEPTPEPSPDSEPTPEPNSEEPLPSSLTLPVVSTGTSNDLGEIVRVISSTPANETLLRLRPYISRFIRSEVADTPSVTNDATRLRYDVTVRLSTRKIGAETQHGNQGLITSTANGFVYDLTPEPFEISRDDLASRFACVTNQPFSFDVPVEHSVWDTNGFCIASHTVSNLLPFGVSAYTNIFFLQKADAPRALSPTSDGTWVSDFDPESFTEKPIAQPVANTLFISAQLFLDEPHLSSLLTASNDSPDDSPDSSSRTSSPSLASLPYDESPGRSSESNDALLEDASDASRSADPWLLEINRPVSLTVDDPRFNHVTYEWYLTPTHTLGTLPDRFPGKPDEEAFRLLYPKFSGYPLLHHDGLPRSIGDIGLLGSCDPWETVDLFQSGNAKLLDLLSLGAPDGTNTPRRSSSRIHAQTPFPTAAALLFADSLFGSNRLVRTDSTPSYKSFCELALDNSSATRETFELLTNSLLTVAADFHPIATNSLQLLELDDAGLASTPPDEDSAIFPSRFSKDHTKEDDLQYAVFPFAQWMEALTPYLLRTSSDPDSDTPSTVSIEDWRNSTLSQHLNDLFSENDTTFAYGTPGLDQLEDLIRDLPDRVSFRQNLVLLIARTDSLAPNGHVKATTRTLSLLYRDSWTGKWHILNEMELK